MAGSAAMPAARCRSRRRGRFIACPRKTARTTHSTECAGHVQKLNFGLFVPADGTLAARCRDDGTSLEIRLVRGRYRAVLSRIIFMRVIGADGFRPLAERRK